MITVKLSNLRISPRKVRLAADLIRGLKVLEAEKQLSFLNKAAAEPILKLLKSAIANAHHQFGLEKDNLRIAKIVVEAGPSMKRWRPRSMGRANRILKRTSSVVLVLEAGDKTVLIKKTAKKTAGKDAKELETKTVLPAKETTEEQLTSEKVRVKTKDSVIPKPAGISPQLKNRVFSRQPLGRVKKKFLRRKSA